MPSRKIRVHILNARERDPLYHITAAQWKAACRRHRALAKRLDATLGWDRDGLGRALRDAQVLIGVPARREYLAQRAPRLERLHPTSAGVHGPLPLDWLARGIEFTNNRGAHGAKLEQYMRMAYTLLNTRLPEMITNQHARRWKPVFSPSIEGQTALIVGLGDLGRGAARAARQLGLKV